jgi:hypothetical protein
MLIFPPGFCEIWMDKFFYHTILGIEFNIYFIISVDIHTLTSPVTMNAVFLTIYSSNLQNDVN